MFVCVCVCDIGRSGPVCRSVGNIAIDIISYQQRASEHVCATLPGLGGSKADAGRAGTWLASKLWEGQGGREQLSAALCMRT